MNFTSCRRTQKCIIYARFTIIEYTSIVIKRAECNVEKVPLMKIA